MGEAAQQLTTGARVALLDLTRCTEQMAILASYAVGLHRRRSPRGDTKEQKKPKSSLNKETLRARAAEAFVTALQCSLLRRARLVQLDPTLIGFAERDDEVGAALHLPSKSIAAHWCAKRLLGRIDRLAPFDGNEPIDHHALFEQLDLIISPLDGIRDLIHGHHGGSMSIIAGGPRGCFDGPHSYRRLFDAKRVWCPTSAGNGQGKIDEAQLQHYFVVVARDADLANSCEAAFEKAKDEVKKSTRVYNIAALGELFRDSLYKWAQQQKAGATAGTKLAELMVPVIASLNTDEPKLCFQELLGYGYPVRVFHGSGVGAALSVMMGKRDCDLFVGVLREHTVYLMAAAARCMGAKLFAFAVDPGADQVMECRSRIEVLDETRFALSQDIFCICTAINEHPVLRGTKILPSGIAQTETLVLNGASRTSRIIKHQRDLALDHFYPVSLADQDKALPLALDAIEEFTWFLPGRKEWRQMKKKKSGSGSK